MVSFERLQLVVAFIAVSSFKISLAFVPAARGSAFFPSTLEAQDVDDDSTPPQVEWGASYIGGDPCGSRYNNDPHAMEIQKPGMPDDMKARIEKLAEEKLKKERQEKEASGGNSL